MINWELIREVYGSNFENKDTEREAFPRDVAYGVLYFQRKPDLIDRELVDQIVENPYMQYFIGYKEYRNERPFDPSLLVSFRKRLPESAMFEILERMPHVLLPTLPTYRGNILSQTGLSALPSHGSGQSSVERLSHLRSLAKGFHQRNKRIHFRGPHQF